MVGLGGGLVGSGGGVGVLSGPGEQTFLTLGQLHLQEAQQASPKPPELLPTALPSPWSGTQDMVVPSGQPPIAPELQRESASPARSLQTLLQD